MKIVEELIYIIGGIIIAYIITEGSKLLKVMLNGKSISLTHLVYCIIAPFVVWQFIYQIIESIEKAGIDSKYAFEMSFLVILNMTIMIMMSALIYPPSIKEYSTENEDFRIHLKESRRSFYLLILVFILTVSLNAYILEKNINPQIVLFRFIMFLFVVICAFINFEPNGEDETTINTNVRYLTIQVAKSDLGVKLIITPRYFTFFKFQSSDRDNKISDIYNFLDLFTAVVIFFAFVAILVVRYAI